MKKIILISSIFIAIQIFAADTKSTSGTWIASRARDQALQTDKFPRPPEWPASGTATTSGTKRRKH